MDTVPTEPEVRAGRDSRKFGFVSGAATGPLPRRRQRHSSEVGCLFEVGRMGTGMPRVCVRVRVPMGVRGAAARAVGAGMRMHPSCTHGREIMYHGRETSCRWGRGCA